MKRIPLSSESVAGDTVDAKPKNGTYCRVFDSMSCNPSVPNLQSIVVVDEKGIQLKQDNCATTSTNFQFANAEFDYSILTPEYVGLSRGIFKKCDLASPQIAMGEAFCTSPQNDMTLVIDKSLTTKELALTLRFLNSSGTRSVKVSSLSKTQNAAVTIYGSSGEQFDLEVTNGISQIQPGRLVAVIDDSTMDMKLECRLSNPKPTVINDDDLEISPTWIDTTQLQGYWKFNEINSSESSSVVDSSNFNTAGLLFTGNDGLNKSALTARGNAFDFDGINDRVQISDPADGHLDFGLGSFTYMVWIYKRGSTSSVDMPLGKGGQNANSPGYGIECGNAVCNATRCSVGYKRYSCGGVCN